MAERYEVTATPTALLVNEDGLIGSHVAVGSDAIYQLVHHIWQSQFVNGKNVHLEGQRNGTGSLPEVAAEDVSFSLLDVDGNLVDKSELLGSRVLLLFWNPNCGYCKAMLPDLLNWERQHVGDSTQIIIVSTGGPELNRAMQLKSRILLDPDFNVASLFGATGTPSAILLNVDDGLSPLLSLERLRLVIYCKKR